LKEKLTVSDSKKLFHEEFPYVIPGLYKKIVDEMIVELNLLNHQNEFVQDNLFCIGLTETFKELTIDYKPEKHLEPLFDSICKSTNFNPSEIKQISKKEYKKYQSKNTQEISDLLKSNNNSKLYNSRILNLGIYLIVSKATNFEEINDSEQSKLVSDIINNLNLSVSKAEKDIGIYKSSIVKFKQAKELLEETKKKDKK